MGGCSSTVAPLFFTLLHLEEEGDGGVCTGIYMQMKPAAQKLLASPCHWVPALWAIVAIISRCGAVCTPNPGTKWGVSSAVVLLQWLHHLTEGYTAGGIGTNSIPIRLFVWLLEVFCSFFADFCCAMQYCWSILGVFLEYFWSIFQYFCSILTVFLRDYSTKIYSRKMRITPVE